jgi:soluble lytic murein transglycosylase-like protein
MDILTALFVTTSMQMNLPDGLLESLCYVETTHNVSAVAYNDGASNSYGICQIKFASAQQMGYKGSEKGLMRPEVNIYYAGKFLRYQIKRYNGNVARGVTAYNKGRSTGDGYSTYYFKVKKQWRVANNVR